MRQFHVPRLALGLAAGLLLASVPARATSIVPISDPILVNRAPVILVGRVLGTLPNVTNQPQTEWVVSVLDVLKGQVGGSPIVVRELGGDTANGRHLTIYGRPEFKSYEKVLLFLRHRADGTWGIEQYLQGAFHVVWLGRRHTAAVRDLSEVQVVRQGRHRGTPRIRDFDEFTDWIRDHVAGVQTQRNYMFRPNNHERQGIAGRFALLDNDGLNLRWFEFDSGGSVTWKAHTGGQPGLPGGGYTEFQTALALWTDERTTPIQLVYAGTTSASGGFQTFDNQNVLLFSDPNNDIDGAFTCGTGGTLAIGGPWSNSNNTGLWDGNTYVRIQGADIITNDGIQCFFNRSRHKSQAGAELFAHEVGHTLGLGHSQKQQALMYYQIHDDGRGARLDPDDVAGLQALYKRGSRGGGGGGGSGHCPAGALCLLHDRFRITATWQNQFDGSSGTAGATPASDISGFLYFSNPSNTELVVKVVDFGDVVKFFWGQLTNFHYTIKVLDTANNVTKTYTNTPGDCGGFDDSGFPSAGNPAAPPPYNGDTQGSCHANSQTLCLLNDRFAVRMDWHNQFNSTSGTGIAHRLSNLTGAFAFTNPANLEILIKTLNFGDHVLVIYGALSNLEYTLTVTDTIGGQVKTYQNPAGQYCGGLDNNAF